MTRVTDFGRKRTYLKAGFGGDDGRETDGGDDGKVEEVATFTGNGESTKPSKKPRKRRRKGKDATETGEGEGETKESFNLFKSSSKEKSGGGSLSNFKDKAANSEKRRLKRIKELQADTTCLACRKKGHLAKECPEAATALEGDNKAGSATVKHTLGICYRCGSRRHNLSRCKKPVDPNNPVPFASCFICSGKGHLASGCTKNNGKGIYPNGGSCKLCQQTNHLAKDCPLRSKEMAAKDTVMLSGSALEAGADEDDFHVLKRRRDALQKEEKSQENSGTVVKCKPKVVVFR